MAEHEVSSTDHDRSGVQYCQYFIQKKKRKCNLVANVSSGFCGAHAPVKVTSYEDHWDGERHRVECPLDRRHTCWSDKLKKHLKVCQRQKERERHDFPVYYKENCNAGLVSDDEEELSKISANSVSRDEVVSLIEKIERLYDVHCSPVHDHVLFDDLLIEALSQVPSGANKARKHILQEASMLAHLREQNLLTPEATHVEFGVGNGHLTYWVGKALGAAGRILAVDRFTVRHKFDRRQDFDHRETVTRLKIDIQHLHLNSVPEIVARDRPLIGYSKHLCGQATDLCLRCVVNAVSCQVMTNSERGSSRVEGLVVALCCHHKGSWRHYVGKDFITELGLTSRDYMIIQSLTSWATCGFHQKHDDSSCDEPKDGASITGPAGLWSPARREEIGARCKRILDQGRIHYLNSYGFHTQLKRYVDATVSKENVLMIVRPKS